MPRKQSWPAQIARVKAVITAIKCYFLMSLASSLPHLCFTYAVLRWGRDGSAAIQAFTATGLAIGYILACAGAGMAVLHLSDPFDVKVFLSHAAATLFYFLLASSFHVCFRCTPKTTVCTDCRDVTVATWSALAFSIATRVAIHGDVRSRRKRREARAETLLWV